MALTKVKLGDYIESSTANNKNLVYGCDLIRGVTNQGVFSMPKGDVSNVDLSPYKMVRNGAFVYNPTRINLGSLAYRNEGLCIVSHLYTVFYLNEIGLRLFEPRWLMMYFHRAEFRREVTFRNFGSQRPEFNFKKMSDIELELPPIEVQRKYVAIYEAMLENQRSYERGLDDLKLTCDVCMEELGREHPRKRISPYIEQSDQRNGGAFGTDDVRGISINKQLIETKANMEGVSLTGYKVVGNGQLVYVPVTSRNGGKISVAINNEESPCIVSSINTVFSTDTSKLLPEYLMLFFSRSEFDRYARFNSWGSARETFDWEDMCDVEIPMPSLATQHDVVDLYNAYTIRKEINERLKAQLKDICPILIKGSLEEGAA